MKIAHFADTHIKNLADHDVYKKVFDQMYERLRQERVDIIVHCGDIAHSKTQITPEFVDIASDFFKNLSTIAPTFIILGNHDGNLKNSDRQDAITPIINALELDNIHLLRNSGEYQVNKDLTLNVLSIFDEDGWVKPSDPDKINIALYHGCIAGCVTDLGYVMTKGDHSVEIFDGFDFGFLGDIHATNQIMDGEGKVRYPGSTIQQGFSETDDKGFLLWDIKGKDSFTCKHISFKNPSPFVTIELDKEGNLPEISLEDNSRVRIITDKKTTLEKIKKAKEIIKVKYNPVSITHLGKDREGKSSKGNNITTFETTNLRDVSYQEKLIEKFLKDYNISEELKLKIFELNKAFNSNIVETDEIERNIHWKIKSFEWDNLFNYGEGNKINFSNLNGVVGIFGKNYSGKSSIIDSLLYTIFNSTSKNNKKNVNVINQKEQKAKGKLEIEINGENYFIERTSEKYVKVSKGIESVEAKSDVLFTSSSESLNGLDRKDTDKTIKKYLGTVDDFFLTSMASQFGFLSFVSEGSTNRKSILAKFLDLESFEKKYKLAKDESSDLKAQIKKLENSDYDALIAKSLAETDLILSDRSSLSNEIMELSKKAKEAKFSLEQVIGKISSINADQFIIDFDSTSKIYKNICKNIDSLLLENENLLLENNNFHLIIQKCNQVLDAIDTSSDEERLKILKEKIIPLEKEIVKLDNNLKSHSHKLKLLDEVPCGDSFPTCKFIKDAFASKEIFTSVKEEYVLKNTEFGSLNKSYQDLDEQVSALNEKKSKIMSKKLDCEKNISLNEIKIEKNKISIERDTSEKSNLFKLLDSYEKNKELIEQYETLNKQKENLQLELDNIKSNAHKKKELFDELQIKYGISLQKVQNFKDQKEELEKLRADFSAYELYIKCMHTSGISYEIIKQKLPYINAEISKILSNIVDFNVFIENDDDKLEIYIKHPGSDPRILELGSGAEKTLASIAVRLALISVTSLPVSDLFIMDEPGTSLDETNLQGFVKILDMIKNNFKTVLIISHLDVLKDCVDSQITINKKGDYAFVDI